MPEVVHPRSAWTAAVAGLLLFSTMGGVWANPRIELRAGARLEFAAAGRAQTEDFVDLASSTLTMPSAGSVLHIAGAWGTHLGTFSIGAGTVEYNGKTGPQVISPYTYFHLRVDKGATVGTLSGTAIAMGGATARGGTFALAPTGVLRIAPTRTLLVEVGGTLASGGGGEITSPTPGTDRYTFRVLGTIDLDGTTIRSGDNDGMQLEPSSTLTNLNKVTFTHHPGGAAGRYITFRRATGRFVFGGCYFDTVPSGYNVHATDTVPGDGSVAKLLLEDRSAAANGPGRGDALDFDDDNAPVDGFSDSGGAVVDWAASVQTRLGGTAEGFAQAAYDLNTFAFYAIYVAFRNLTGGIDRITSRNLDGTDRGTRFEIPAANGDIVGIPWWDTDPGTGDHILFAVTTGGWIYKWIDPGAGAGLVAPAWSRRVDEDPGAGIALIDEITSPVISDGAKLYFGGRRGATYKVYGIRISDQEVAWVPPATKVIRTAPSWEIQGGTTWLVVGSDAAAGSANIYRIDATLGLIDKTNTTPVVPGADVIADTTMTVGTLFVGDRAGVMHGVDALDDWIPALPDFENLTGWPFAGPGAEVRAAAFADPFAEIYWGDMAGNLMIANLDGSPHDPDLGGPLTAYPLALDGGTPIESAPLALSGVVYVGNNDGKLMMVDRSTKTHFRVYDMGPVMVSDISYLYDTDQYMVATSDGNFLIFNAEPDPTP